MKTNKILIMMLYYDRPALVAEALKSIVRADQHHKDWHLAFHDDASPTPGEPVVRTFLTEDMMDKVTFYRTVATKEQKLTSGGMLGHVMNQMIKDSDADVAIILCDDDVLHEHYLANLDRYFTTKENVQACYSHVVVFDPSKEGWETATNTDNPLNYYTAPVNPENKLDACQVAWRTSLCKGEQVWFPYPCHKNQDAGFYKAVYETTGAVPFSGFVGQYKAIHAGQLSQDGHDDSPEVLVGGAVKVAFQHYLNGDVQEAKRLYEQVLKVRPCHPVAANMVGVCELRINGKQAVPDGIP